MSASNVGWVRSVWSELEGMSGEEGGRGSISYQSSRSDCSFDGV